MESDKIHPYKVNVFTVDETTGALDLVAIIDYSYDADSGQEPAEIELHPTLPVLYISDRDTGAMHVFDIVSADDG